MTFPYTDLGETYFTPDIPNLPPVFEVISYALAFDSSSFVFLLISTPPVTLVASSMSHRCVLF